MVEFFWFCCISMPESCMAHLELPSSNKTPHISTMNNGKDRSKGYASIILSHIIFYTADLSTWISATPLLPKATTVNLHRYFDFTIQDQFISRWLTIQRSKQDLYLLIECVLFLLTYDQRFEKRAQSTAQLFKLGWIVGGIFSGYKRVLHCYLSKVYKINIDRLLRFF